MQSDTAWMVYRYQQHMKEALGLNARTIDARLRHVHRFLEQYGCQNLAHLRSDDLISYKKTLLEADPSRSASYPAVIGTPAPATLVRTLHNLKAFLEWLRGQKGYRTLPSDLPAYCSPPRKLTAIASAAGDKHVPTAEDIRQILAAIPASTIQQRRDRAVIAFLLLTGIRDGVLITLRLKHVDLQRRLVIQDPQEVATKFSKSMRTAWFPVGEDIADIVIDWVQERRYSGADGDAPLFPRLSAVGFSAPGHTSRQFWKTADPVRTIIRKATEAAGLPYFRPHAVRSTLGLMFQERAWSIEELKALSQNLGHEDLGTTLQYYGKIDQARQQELI